MNSPLAHSTLARAAALEQEARERNLVRADDTRSQPVLIARRRALASPARRLRLPSLPLPRRLAPSGSR